MAPAPQGVIWVVSVQRELVSSSAESALTQAGVASVQRKLVSSLTESALTQAGLIQVVSPDVV